MQLNIALVFNGSQAQAGRLFQSKPAFTMVLLVRAHAASYCLLQQETLLTFNVPEISGVHQTAGCEHFFGRCTAVS